MEPNYVGTNGRIDAMAVAWLFANDYVFFNPGEITWDGSGHGISGIQINAAKMDEIPVFVDNVQQLMNGVADLLLTLEGDEGIRVPRSAIHPALHDAIREGDLTALTLFNLQACARAFSFLDGEYDELKRSTLEMAGFDGLAGDPIAMACTHMITVDQRLTRGIPGFYQLVRRMFEGMRAYNEVDLPYVLVFAASRNIDADQCFGDFDGMVDGAVSESLHIETNIEEWRASHEENALSEFNDDLEGADAEWGASEGGDEEADGRSLAINMLRLLVLSSQLAGTAAFPQEMLDELDRAEAGDEGVDLDDLARRMNEMVPEAQAADLSNVTYDEGAIAKGRRFNVAAPDGWTVVYDYAEQTFLGEQVRPFVLVQGDAGQGENLEMRDRIIYSALGGDTEVDETKAELGTHDLAWATRFCVTYDRSDDGGFGAMKPIAVWDTEVDAVNTKCFVVQQQVRDEGANGLEFNIFPYANDHTDFLRVVLAYEDGVTDIDRVREAVMALASTIELDKPVVCDCEKKLREALAGRVAADDFVRMAEGFSKPYIGLRQMVYTSAQYKHVAVGGSVDDESLTIAGAEAIAGFCNRAVSVLERLVNAYEVQKGLGAEASELVDMLEAVEAFSNNAFPNAEIFEGQDRAVVRKANVFAPIDELKAVREKLSAAKAKAEAERKALEKAELERKRQEEEEKAQAAKRFFELDEKIKIAEKKKASLSKPVETDSEKEAAKISAEIADMESELGNLGFFARSRKKELQASIAEKRASLSAVKAKIPAERDAAESMRKSALAEVSSEINALQTEIAPYKAIVLEGVVKELEGKKAGESVFFGSYRQESSTAKATPIEWIVLETQGDCMLLLSKKVLACRKFRESKSGANTYAASDLCKWLTGAFAEEAFSAVDQQILVGDPYVLGASDLKKYLRSERGRRCEPTGFAASQGAKPASYHKVAGSTFYWVGTPEGNENFYYVNPYGAVLGGGGYTIVDGTTLDNCGQNATYESGVRPAVRVRLK